MSGFPKLVNGRVNPQVSNILLAYRNQNFLADEILPTVPNLKDDEGVIAKMGNEHLRLVSTKRAVYDRSEHLVKYEISNSDTYKIDYYDAEVYLPDRIRDQLQLPFMAERDSAFVAKQVMMLEREKALADLMSSTTTLTNNVTLSASTDKWTDKVNSTPDDDIFTGLDSVVESTGFEANSAVMSRKVANALRKHPFYLNIALQTLAGGTVVGNQLSQDQLVAVFKSRYNLDRVLIGKQIYISSVDGQTDTTANIWDDSLTLFYRSNGPALMEPSFGYSFQLAGKNLRSSKRRDPKGDVGDLIRVDWGYQDNILLPDSAYLIKSAI